MRTGHSALVTGSSAGIGLAIARALSRTCAAVVLNGVGADAAEAALAGLDAGCRGVAVAADIGSEEGRARIAGACGNAGLEPDIVVLNASIQVDQTLAELTEAEAERQFRVNVIGSLALVRDVLPAMKLAGWGRVVAIGSVQETRPNARSLVYSASKAALTHAMLNLARHEAVPGVTFNVVRPGAVATRRNADVLADDGYRSRVLAAIPMRRIGVPEDCAGVVEFICSDAAGYLNGAVVDVDGGMRL